jgi:hypothetical protein
MPLDKQHIIESFIELVTSLSLRPHQTPIEHVKEGLAQRDQGISAIRNAKAGNQQVLYPHQDQYFLNEADRRYEAWR